MQYIDRIGMVIQEYLVFHIFLNQKANCEMSKGVLGD